MVEVTLHLIGQCERIAFARTQQTNCHNTRGQRKTQNQNQKTVICKPYADITDTTDS